MYDWFVQQWETTKEFLYRLVLTVFDMLKDLIFWVFEQFMYLGVLALDGLGTLFNGLDIAQYITLLPAETLHILSLVGFSEALGMIISCLIIRFIIQMIPFVRWGS